MIHQADHRSLTSGIQVCLIKENSGKEKILMKSSRLWLQTIMTKTKKYFPDSLLDTNYKMEKLNIKLQITQMKFSCPAKHFHEQESMSM